MPAVIQNFIHQRPVFETLQEPIEASFLRDNREIKQLVPSERIQNKILLFVDKIFKAVLEWLYPFEKTDYAGIVAAFDRTNDANGIQFTTLQPNHLLAYFKRFFEGDCAACPEIGECINQLQEQMAAIQKLRAPREENEAVLQRLREPLNQWITAVEQLEVGKQKLIIASDAAHNELFYLFSRDAGGINLKVIGRGQAMVDLSGVREVGLAGKVKIPSCLEYQHIPAAQIRNLLELSPLGRNPMNLEMREILAQLPTQPNVHNLNALATKTENHRKVLETVFKQIQFNANQGPLDTARSKLRLKVYTLFSILKEYRHTLLSNTRDLNTLERMFHLAAQSLNVARQKGVINQQELETLVQELSCIKEVIDAARGNPLDSSPVLKLPSMNLSSATPITTTQGIVLPASAAQVRIAPAQQRAPQTQPAFANEPIQQEAEPTMLPPSALHQIPADGTAYQIAQMVYAIDFFPHAGQAVNDAFHEGEILQGEIPAERAEAWSNLTREEAIALVGKIRSLSERLKELSKFPGQLSLDTHLALIKMTYMVGYLDRYKINPDNQNHWFARSLSYLFYGDNRDLSLSGLCIDPRNLATYTQLRHYTITTRFQPILQIPPREPELIAEAAHALPHLYEQKLLLSSIVDTYLRRYPPLSTLLSLGHFDDTGSFSAMHNRIPSLSATLFSAYFRLKIRESELWYSEEIDYRDTQEAISHDPQSNLNLLSDSFIREIRRHLKFIYNDLTPTTFDQTFGLNRANEILDIREEISPLLQRAEENLVRAAALEEDFSEEELTALLSLLRPRQPQSELIAFMDAHESMLSSPQVRSFVNMIFFSPELLFTLKHRVGSNELKAMMPRFFAEKINALRQKLEENSQDPNALARLVFFLQMSDSLQGIYAQTGLSTAEFFQIDTMHDQLTALRSQFAGQLVEQGLTALQLRTLFKKDQLSLREFSQAIIDMQSLKPHLENHPTITPMDADWLTGRYEKLLNRMVNAGHIPLVQEQLSYILDTVCHQKGLLLDNSAWRGNNFVFENDQYEVDLIKGSLRDKHSPSIHTHLSADQLADPLFRKSFPDIGRTTKIQATLYVQEDGTKIYQFNDGQNNRCQVQEKNGIRTCYRTLNGRLLQAVSPFSGEQIADLPALLRNSQQENLGTFDLLKKLIGWESASHSTPAILKRAVFLDPQSPQTGFIISDAGKLELELELEHSSEGVKVKAVHDLRGEQRSEALIVASAGHLDHKTLKQLEQFESLEHILLWAEKGNPVQSVFFDSPVKKIELTRYGLTFCLERDRFVCQDPRYAGYSINFGASLEDKKGFAHAIVLEHADRTKPAKLLVPQASSIIPEIILPEFPSGLALIIWVIRSLIEFWLDQTFSFGELRTRTKIDPSKHHLDLIAIDLNPHTKELVYETGKATTHAQELIKQAIASNNTDLAYEVFHGLSIEKNPLEIRKWIRFAAALQPTPAATLGLKITTKLHSLIRRDEIFKEVRKELKLAQVDLFKAAMAQGKKVSGTLRLSQEEFQKLASLIKKQEPTYYQFHIQPFLEQGREIQLPTVYTDGREANIPLIVEQPPQQRERLTRVRELEALLNPGVPATIEELTTALPLVQPVRLLFSAENLESHFDMENVVIGAPTALLRQVISPKLEEITQLKAEAEANVQTLLTSQDIVEQLSFYATDKRLATKTELMLALVQDDLATLRDQGFLPAATDLVQLRGALIRLYDTEIKLQLMTRSKEMALEMIQENAQMSEQLKRTKSIDLFDTLTSTRRYSPETNPELLIFEAFHFMTYRESGAQGQLDLLQTILGNPNGITQAGTGSGKSSVLNILRALKKANGHNLVTYKVLPQLYEETLALMQNRFEKTFKRKVYAFQFNLQMPMQNGQGHSIFAEIYQKMLETMHNKGCILTDYKSFPLLEEKFWSLNQELLAARTEGIEPTDLQLSHWNNLRNILILLQNKEDQMMDEFDEPNRPVHRIQVQIQAGSPAPDFMIETALDLYNRLLQEPDLQLRQNLQGDISPQTRLECIHRVAEQIAHSKADNIVSWQQLKDYMLGINELALNNIAHWTQEQKDILAFLKDEFYTYLPLTLSQSGISKYQRSKDGKRILVCVQGEPREAKFGNIIEEINYSIQDYRQHGVALPTLRAFVINAIKDFRDEVAGAQERFNETIPNIALDQLAALSPEELNNRIAQDFLPAVNQSPAALEFFLRKHLSSLKSSGCVASMTPQDAVAMSRVVSGVSATVGSLGALHTQFQADQAEAVRVQNEMIARLRRRTIGEPILYNPATPLERLTQGLPTPLTAIIDGSGAFRECSSRSVAEALRRSNPALRKVEYYEDNGALNYVGEAQVPLEAKGFYFAQAYTRGADQLLKPDAVALLTVSEPGKMEDLSQHEGRMRQSTQRIIIAVSQFAPETMRTLEGIIERKQQNEMDQNADEFYRGNAQGLQETLRTRAKKTLLPHNDLNAFLDAFNPCQNLFIQPASAAYGNAGDYFQRHQAITPRNGDPLLELRALQTRLIQQANLMGIPTAELEAITYPDTLRQQLPRQVSPLTTMQDQQLEVEEEREEQNELETEQEMEEEQNMQTGRVTTGPKVASYLPRRQTAITYSAADRIHPSFDPKIRFTDGFLPLQRQHPLHRRVPFDDRMNRIGVIRVGMGNLNEIAELEIGDLVDNPGFPRTLFHEIPAGHQHPLLGVQYIERNESLGPIQAREFLYDVRTRQIIWAHIPDHNFADIVNSPEFRTQVAQIRFMDGQIDGYSEQELADLTQWLERNNVQDMRQLFEQRVLQNRPEVRARYRHSPLWNLFEQNGTRCTIRTF